MYNNVIDGGFFAMPHEAILSDSPLVLFSGSGSVGSSGSSGLFFLHGTGFKIKFCSFSAGVTAHRLQNPIFGELPQISNGGVTMPVM